jgi:hypothetical protein
MSGNDLNFLPQQERTANYSQSSSSPSHLIKIAADSNSTSFLCEEATLRGQLPKFIHVPHSPPNQPFNSKIN